MRQVYEVHKFLQNQKKVAFGFPIEMGIYRCRSSANAKVMGDELSKFGLKLFNERRSYDPQGIFASRLGQNQAHVPTVEDFSVNCDDEFEVRRRNNDRFTLQ